MTKRHVLLLSAALAAIAPFVARTSTARAQTAEPFEEVSRADLMQRISEIQALPQGEELSSDDLRMEAKAQLARRIERADAVSDVERFFKLLADGYCGYGAFSERGGFGQAEESAKQVLAARETLSPDELADLLRAELDFVHDCHLRVGERVFCAHQDWWLEPKLELSRVGSEFAYESAGTTYTLVSVNDSSVESFVLPSLNAAGESVYRLGLLSASEPEPLRLRVRADGQETLVVRSLRRSEFDAGRQFGLTRMGGVPVVRASSFADVESQALGAFLDTADELRGEPFVVLDVRGNGGGNTDWPKDWVTRFTGHSPSLKQVLTELESRTTMIGRANVFRSMLAFYPDRDAGWLQAEIDGYEARAAAFDDPAFAPRWTPAVYPDTRRIANDTTIIVVVDRHVASAGEGLVSYLYRQVDNVVIVGENTMGALEYGQISYHQLPRSRLLVVLPIKLNVPLDLVRREEVGFRPDLWVPPAHAVNYAVAAVREGTIMTRSEVPEGYFDARFVPERTWRVPVERKWLPAIVGATAFAVFLLSGLVRRRRSRSRS